MVTVHRVPLSEFPSCLDSHAPSFGLPQFFLVLLFPALPDNDFASPLTRSQLHENRWKPSNSPLNSICPPSALPRGHSCAPLVEATSLIIFYSLENNNKRNKKSIFSYSSRHFLNKYIFSTANGFCFLLRFFFPSSSIPANNVTSVSGRRC